MKNFIKDRQELIFADHEYTADELISIIRNAKKELPLDAKPDTNITFTVALHSYPYCDTAYPKLFAIYERLETDAEEGERLRIAAMIAEAARTRKNNEYAEYKRLEKLFGKDEFSSKS